MKKYPKSIRCSTSIDDIIEIIEDLQDKLDLIASGPELFNDSQIELLAKDIDDFNRNLGLDLKLMDDGFTITSSSEPDATYRNRRNPNKFIETKKYNDGHRVARQYMKWDTPDGEIKNYTGAKDAKRGRYFRTRKSTLDSMLEDYDEVIDDFDDYDDDEI